MLSLVAIFRCLHIFDRTGVLLVCVGPLREEELTETTFQKFHLFADVEL
jgi:hypothetical protein